MELNKFNQTMKYLTRPAEGPAKTLSDDPLETPPVFQTGDPQEAVKEVIRRTQGQVPGIRVSPGVSFNPLGTAEDQDPSLTGRFGVGGGELEFGVKEDEGFIGFRKQFEKGGAPLKKLEGSEKANVEKWKTANPNKDFNKDLDKFQRRRVRQTGSIFIGRGEGSPKLKEGTEKVSIKKQNQNIESWKTNNPNLNYDELPNFQKARIKRTGNINIGRGTGFVEDAEGIGLKQKERDKKRRDTIKKIQKYDLRGTKQFPVHHVFGMAEGLPVSTQMISVIEKEINSAIAPYNKRINRVSKDLEKIRKEKPKNYKQLIEKLNAEGKGYVELARRKLPKNISQYIGYIRLDPETLTYKTKSFDPQLSIAGLDNKKIIREMDKEEISKLRKAIETLSEKKMVSRPTQLFSGLAALPEMGRIGKEMITQDVPKFGKFAGQVAKGAKGTLKLAGKGARMLVGPVELPLTIAAGGLYANYQNQLDFAKALDRTNLSENKKNDLKNKFRRAELGLDVGVGEEILVDTMGTESDIIGGIKDPDKIAQYQKVAFDAINAERDIQAEKLEQLRKEAQTIEVDEDFDVL